jgi:hypothetical protein
LTAESVTMKRRTSRTYFKVVELIVAVVEDIAPLNTMMRKCGGLSRNCTVFISEVNELVPVVPQLPEVPSVTINQGFTCKVGKYSQCCSGGHSFLI